MVSSSVRLMNLSQSLGKDWTIFWLDMLHISSSGTLSSFSRSSLISAMQPALTISRLAKYFFRCVGSEGRLEYPIHQLANCQIQAPSTRLAHWMAGGIPKHGGSDDGFRERCVRRFRCATVESHPEFRSEFLCAYIQGKLLPDGISMTATLPTFLFERSMRTWPVRRSETLPDHNSSFSGKRSSLLAKAAQ